MMERRRVNPAPGGRRILVTGSRDWERRGVIEYALKEHAQPGDVLVSGHAPHGADRMAEEYWSARGGAVETWPADWETHGRRAGFVRNAEMVLSGVDVCLAFIRNGSRGASMTADYAEKSGVPVVRYVHSDAAPEDDEGVPQA